MNIAIFSPMPPQRTGIADYSEDLIQQLSTITYCNGTSRNGKSPNEKKTNGKNGNRNKIKITLIINQDYWDDYQQYLKTVEKTHYINKSHINTLNSKNCPEHDFTQYNQIIYHLGNHGQFHHYMLPTLKNYGGIIHLHDLVLQQLLATETKVSINNREKYLNIIHHTYSKQTADYINQLMDANYKIWQTDKSHLLPAFEVYLKYADACIVHSQFLKQKIQEKFPDLAIYKIEQLYNLEKYKLPTKIQTDKKVTLTIGIFGGVENNRKVDDVLQALSNLSQKYKVNNYQLIIVGAIANNCQDIIQRPKQLGIEEQVTIHSHVNKQTFHQLLQSIDLLIALRQPTVGETSAVVMQALQYHKVIIVNNVGWYQELPDDIDKIKPQNNSKAHQQEIENLLLKYLTIENGQLKYWQKKQISRQNTKIINQQKNDEKYVQVILKHRRKKKNQWMLDKIYDYVNELDLLEHRQSLKRLISKVN